MNDRGFATGPDPLSNGFVDNRDKIISALEAELSTTRETRDESTANANRAWSKVVELETENAALKAALKAAYEILKAALDAAQDDAARLRAAILAINVDGDDWCPWCAEHPSHGHAADCQRQAALAQTSEVKA